MTQTAFATAQADVAFPKGIMLQVYRPAGRPQYA
jgi:hypothetical protein